MIRKDADVRSGLQTLHLTDDEIEVYLALLRGPSTPLILSRETEIKRTKIYHVLEVLQKRSLITKQADERGSFFVITDPINLGIQLGERQDRLKEEHDTFVQLVPMLSALRSGPKNSPFLVRTYEGVEGFKQMCWHELKTQGETLTLGGGDIEELVPDRRWAERHRQRMVDVDYNTREILNIETDLPTFIDNPDFLQRYSCRGLSATILPLENQTVIYNDTVAIYHWRQEKKVGVEIISKTFADSMRSIFEHYWKLAEPAKSRPL